MTDTDVKSYLTYLAVKCKVAPSTQNQALNSLLFLYRHILKKDFGDHKDVPRAKKSKYIPVVLSRREIDAVLKHLSYPYDLVVKLLYGCGLCLFECIKLRVQNFNFDEGILSIQDGKEKESLARACSLIASSVTGSISQSKCVFPFSPFRHYQPSVPVLRHQQHVELDRLLVALVDQRAYPLPSCLSVGFKLFS